MPEPEKVFMHGSCRAAVFVNEIKTNDGTGKIKNVTILKSYKDKDDNWKNSNSFGVNDLPKLILVAQKAYEYMTIRRE